MQEIVVTFSDWQFFMRESMNTEAMHVLVKYDGKIPIGIVWNDGVDEVKFMYVAF
ncbi:Translationally-controlled tumor protein-like protein, partial [Trichoplax sp. H2]